MQKDFHFYLTYGLARHAGVVAKDAEIIAWADQYTDEVKDAALHGLQTQCGVSADGNWEDGQVQMTVLVPFHFVPGNDKKIPWKTTRNSPRARKLVKAGLKDGPVRLGIALHAFQDSYSHENFTGCREDINSCFPWFYPASALPNVGHAEMRGMPDCLHYVWTDPRSGVHIDNAERGLLAAEETFKFLVDYSGKQDNLSKWPAMSKRLLKLFKLTDYDKRVTGICKWSGNDKVDFTKTDKRLRKTLTDDFAQAASGHLGDVMGSVKNLPWLK